MTPPTKIYYLIRQLQEPHTYIGNPRHYQDYSLGIYQLCLLTQARYVQYLWLFYDSIIVSVNLSTIKSRAGSCPGLESATPILSV